jgi:hypothetical protein
MISATPQDVLKLLRQLPPRERLKVISQALPEIEQNLSENVRAYKSLCGLWKDLLPSVSEKDIDDARREMWKDFPREDIV